MDLALERLHTIPPDVYAAVEVMAGATLYHKQPWHKVLESSLGWRIQAYVDFDATGALSFFLPFVEKRSLSGRRSLISLPLSHYVPALGRVPHTPSAKAPPLFQHADAPIGWSGAVDESRVITRLHMGADETAEALTDRFGKNLKRYVKRAKKAGYTVAVENAPEALSAFSRLQAETRRKQGSPTFPRNFFHVLARHMAPDFRLHLVRTTSGAAVAGIVFLDDGESAIYGYGASVDDRDVWRDGVNQLAMSHAIQSAMERGRRTIDFGATPKLLTDLIRYKERWGGISEDLHYCAIGTNVPAQPDRESLPLRLASDILKRLPLPVFQAISPTLLKLAA